MDLTCTDSVLDDKTQEQQGNSLSMSRDTIGWRAGIVGVCGAGARQAEGWQARVGGTDSILRSLLVAAEEELPCSTAVSHVQYLWDFFFLSL